MVETSAAKRLVRNCISLSVFQCVVLSTVSADQRPYSVDDLLKTEGIGQVILASESECALFEKIESYDSAGDYARYFSLGRDRTQVYVSKIDEPSAARPLFGKGAENRFWLGSVSPGGKRVALFSHYNRQIRAHIADTDCSGHTIMSRIVWSDEDLAPNQSVYLANPIWLSDDIVVFSALPSGQNPEMLTRQRESAEVLPALWRQAWSGRESTASVLRSGERSALKRPSGSLVLINVQDGSKKTIAAGQFESLLASPHNETIAALRRAEYFPLSSDRRLDWFPPDRRHELVLINTDGASDVKVVCDDCGVLLDSLSWSASGKSLSFFARRSSESWTDASYYIYDLEEGQLSRLRFDSLVPIRGNRGVPSFANHTWLGERLALRLETSQASDVDDWFIIDSNSAPKNLTRELRTTPEFLLAPSAEGAFAIIGGELWHISADGVTTHMPLDLDGKLSPWLQFNFLRQPMAASQDRPQIVAKLTPSLSSDGVLAESTLILDPVSGEKTIIPNPPGESVLLGISIPGEKAMFQVNSSGESEMQLVDSSGRKSEIHRLNQHLKGVVAGRHIALEHSASNGPATVDWLILPPNHQDADQIPLVVYIYPGLVFGATRPMTLDIGQFNVLNPELLAGHGFAVLLPSIPLTPMGVPGDPMHGLSDLVLAAIDRVAEAGYFDGEAVAVMGHSLGGYGVLGLITQTDRFKAAIAIASISNLTSVYGQPDIRRKVNDTAGLRLIGAALAEAAHFRMGTTPWHDPDRYIRNSPIFFADRVDTPLLLLHGDQDYISIGQSEEMFTALYRQGKDAELVRYWGEGHLMTSPSNIRDMWRRIFAWVSIHVAEAK